VSFSTTKPSTISSKDVRSRDVISRDHFDVAGTTNSTIIQNTPTHDPEVVKAHVKHAKEERLDANKTKEAESYSMNGKNKYVPVEGDVPKVKDASPKKDGDVNLLN
jgi:hypothetical protein